LQRRAERREYNSIRLAKEAKDSYLNVEQYEFMTKMYKHADNALKQQQGTIDMME